MIRYTFFFIFIIYSPPLQIFPCTFANLVLIFIVAPSPAVEDGKKDEELRSLQQEMENLRLNLTEKDSALGRLVSIM